MRRSFLNIVLSCAAPALLLGACGTLPGAQSAGPQAKATAAESVEGASTYGLFLAGEAAMARGQTQDAGRLFSEAMTRPDADPILSERAFTATLLAGDVPGAARLAPTSPESAEAVRRMGALVRAVEALAEGDGKTARALLASDEIAFPHQAAAALLKPWAAAEAGDMTAALEAPAAGGDRVLSFFGLLGRGQIAERARRYEDADAAFKSAVDIGLSPRTAALAYGAFLERRGRKLDAGAVYETALAADPADRGLMAAKARAATGRKAPPQPTLQQGASQALLAPTAAMVAAKQIQIALGYLHLVLRLDPGRDDAWVLVGDMLQAGGDTDGARAAYARPKPGSVEFAEAQSKLAWTYQADGDNARALQLAQAAAGTGDRQARLGYADLLRGEKRYEEAVTILTTVMAEQKQPNWRLLYMRGVTLSQLDRWTEAEADLRAALALQPDDPELLNFLGYSWIDRGERLPEALAMVKKAVAANPSSGAMVDSLGWAYYRMGDYKEALAKLEEAVGLDAGDPEINDHLGDVYWRVGRKDEAMFQWRRVLTLDPDAKIRASAERKIAAGGLGAEPRRVAGN
ncbi:tetratricopeptide repeat protein [Phenylobacterium immobile]|uniref:tetratricopeptide repeat protein n=1 Tax=Phenylobacterium immobile TaxID=21 RepID=UPI000A597ADF|nr:tetratricopeptide repeat protein [Phenylobacterium immobile]